MAEDTIKKKKKRKTFFGVDLISYNVPDLCHFHSLCYRLEFKVRLKSFTKTFTFTGSFQKKEGYNFQGSRLGFKISCYQNYFI